MKKTICFLTLFFISFIIKAQLCPGGGTTFATAVFFNPSWVSGCSSGTSCSGGTTFDNRAACEPTTAIDACAPAPTSCATLANTGSDLWFKFYASGTSTTINLIQSVSFIATIQVFSGGGTGCGSLNQISCVIAGGPSSGVSTSFSTTKNTLYYFRVFGTATSSSQRTGTFCFCGSTGLSNIILPIKLISFSGNFDRGSVALKWTTGEQSNFSHFEVERSEDGIRFATIGKVQPVTASFFQDHYSFTDPAPSAGENFYRLKMIDLDGSYEYSSILKVIVPTGQQSFNASFDYSANQIIIQSDRAGEAEIYSISGSKLFNFKITRGINRQSLDGLKNGIYVVKRKGGGEKQKISVLR